ncbi:hypothetical protein J421_5738 (plasmid) [Gemmatirosa kalamazoonensis]|uniref:DUF4142 domain-containing protein n=2 Tax=Gemmatirosa kalamazoonensis TaxID=861299 RepID=W0RUM9_9BACT|nr:hypothetical protein J421_5738 [Gemmatirosa kalamazoonensis]
MTRMLSARRSRRTLGVLLLTLAALAGASHRLGAQQQRALSPTERGEIGAYPLSMDNVKRIIATAGTLLRLQATDPAFDASVKGMSNESITAQGELLEHLPKAAAALRAGRLTAHEFAIGSRAYGGAQAIANFQARGRPLAPNAKAQMDRLFPVTPAQVAFVTAHKTEIDALVRADLPQRARP